MSKRQTTDAFLATVSQSTRAANARQGAAVPVPAGSGALPISKAKCLAPFGRCPHTNRPYRSRTEARWAEARPEHRYEALAIATPAGVYWPDFVGASVDWDGSDPATWDEGRRLYEVKGSWIRDRALHKPKAAIRPARALGFAGIWLAVYDKGNWTVTELEEG